MKLPALAQKLAELAGTSGDENMASTVTGCDRLMGLAANSVDTLCMCAVFIGIA